MTFSFRPLSLAEVHRRRATRTPFFVDVTVAETEKATKNEDDREEELA